MREVWWLKLLILVEGRDWPPNRPWTSYHHAQDHHDNPSRNDHDAGADWSSHNDAEDDDDNTQDTSRAASRNGGVGC